MKKYLIILLWYVLASGLNAMNVPFCEEHEELISYWMRKYYDEFLKQPETIEFALYKNKDDRILHREPVWVKIDCQNEIATLNYSEKIIFPYEYEVDNSVSINLKQHLYLGYNIRANAPYST